MTKGPAGVRHRDQVRADAAVAGSVKVQRGLGGLAADGFLLGRTIADRTATEASTAPSYRAGDITVAVHPIIAMVPRRRLVKFCTRRFRGNAVAAVPTGCDAHVTACR